jgi:HD-GYP domain-containing protein (c-di-GMP phosphodiesterase class II)
LIQEHPGRGHSILAHIDHLTQIRPAVLHHHEHFDGQGYPAGLAGGDIPLTARIIAVADAYDAMASDRPYRPALPADKILATLRNGAGSQWDPQVVQAFLEITEEIYELCAPIGEGSRAVPGVDFPTANGGLLPRDDIAAAVATTYASPAGS